MKVKFSYTDLAMKHKWDVFQLWSWEKSAKFSDSPFREEKNPLNITIKFYIRPSL